MASICSVNYLLLLHFYIVEVLRLFYNKSGEYIKTNVPSLRDEHNLLSFPVAKKEIFITFITVLKPRFHNYLPEEIKDMPYKTVIFETRKRLSVSIGKRVFIKPYIQFNNTFYMFFFLLKHKFILYSYFSNSQCCFCIVLNRFV